MIAIRADKGLKNISFLPVKAGRVALCAIFASVLAVPAYADDISENNNLDPEAPSSGLIYNLEGDTLSDTSEFVGLSSSLKGVVAELPAEAVGSKLFDLDIMQAACISGDEGCTKRIDRLDMEYSRSLTTSFDSFLDVELTPRASVSFTDESSSALVGALIKIGDDLRDGEELKSNTWYVFAGADAEAVSYAPDSVRRITEGDFHLQDKILVGDTQAGVGYRMGDADLSLGYFRREVDSGVRSFDENAAALSFTWRR